VGIDQVESRRYWRKQVDRIDMQPIRRHMFSTQYLRWEMTVEAGRLAEQANGGQGRAG